MEKIDQILESLYDRVIEPMEAKEQLLDLFDVIKKKSRANDINVPSKKTIKDINVCCGKTKMLKMEI